MTVVPAPLTDGADAADAAALRDVIWRALSVDQRDVSTGTDRARRYARGFSPIAAFADVRDPAFDDLVDVLEPGEQVYTDGWDGPVPPGWRVEAESRMHRMAWTGPAPPRDESLPDGTRALTPDDAPAALALAQLTRPGPFGLRTPELGLYLGVFTDGRLMALAGERMHAHPWREISGVCTHPEARGRGLAGALMRHLVARQLARGERPFLHVMHDNATALGLYERMGFRTRGVSVVRVVSRERGTTPA